MATTVDLQPFTHFQQFKISVFTKEGEILPEVLRRLEYIRTDSQVKIRLGQEVLAGMAIGGATGSLGGLCIYLANLFPPIPSPLAFVAKAAAIGAIAGGILGLPSGIKTHVIEIDSSDEYKRWRAEAIRDRVFPLFQEFIQRLDEEEEFLCPITHQLIRVPVKACDEKVYEQEAIEQWITVKTQVLAYQYLRISEENFNAQSPEERKATLQNIVRRAPREKLKEFSPYCICYIQVENLRYDFDYHKNLFQRLKKVFNREVKTQVKEGLLKYVTDVQSSKKQIAKNLISEAAAQFAVKQMSKEEFDRKVEKLQRLCALEPIT